jgi:hypothetical protein
VVFGDRGGLVEVSDAGAGFLHSRRAVYESDRERLGLSACNERFGPPMVPFFRPMVVPDGGGHWYLADDFAFCQRVRSCGFTIMADTSFRLKHLGPYAFTWEDAEGERERFARFTDHIEDWTGAWILTGALRLPPSACGDLTSPE